MKLTDAQFLESKRFRIEDVCRVFRVPLHLVQDLSRSTNNNIEHQGLEFIVYTMLPWFKRWEENFKDRKSTRLNSSHANISYAVFCLKKKNYSHVDHLSI